VQQIAVVTLGIAGLAASRRFYVDGFGWAPVFATDEIAFFQMNGLVLGLWLADRLAADMGRPVAAPGAVALAHNVRTQDEVEPLVERLLAHGGQLLRSVDAPPHGGRRGYVADPDGHAWEIAWNPAWPIADDGSVRFSA
jgi:uncharacterized protein